MFGFSSQSLRRSVGALSIATVSLIAITGSACAWQTAHGNPDNSGTVDVSTAPAVTPLNTVRGLGGIAPGMVPVIAPNGTLYIGNARGKLMSFRPDGTPGWSRDLGQQSITSAPALGSDGSIYIIGHATIRDHRTTPTTVTRIAELHKFTAGGGWLWHVPLPGAERGLDTSAPPNILRLNGMDVVLVPAMQKSSGTFNATLTAFSQDGPVLAHTIATSFAPQATASTDWDSVFCDLVSGGRACTFTPSGPFDPNPEDRLPGTTRIPFPAVAVHAPIGGVPTVMVAGGFQDFVGLAFTGSAFEERFRVHEEKRFFSSTPLAWPNGRAMATSNGHQMPSQVVFAGFQMSTLHAAGPLSVAAPTALGNSRFAIVGRTGGLTIMRGAVIENEIPLPGDSMASAAASSNHLFVATASALHTFDKTTLEQKGVFAWTKGGVSQPVIGPQGHVYAIAGDSLFVFAPTATAPSDAPTTPAAQSQAYAPPLTTGGNRLFACEKLDGDDCGKGDARDIAKAFCAKQGYGQADDIDVDSKKVKAETLDGQFCSKKKCRVFEQIVCKM